MKQLIYTKYSDERSVQFSLYTEIWEDENGNRSVRKVPESKEGWEHLKHIKASHDKLTELYVHQNIGINACQLTPEGLELEYLTGNNYENMIDQILCTKGTEAAIEKLEEYLKMVIPTDKLLDFEMTDSFQKVFGKLEIPENTKTLPVTNIDMIMANMICADDKFDLIDYEWTFDFPIPVKYVIYRVIHYYIECNAIRVDLKSRNIYQNYQISEPEIQMFTQMEKNFQDYICGERVPIREMHKDISPGAYPVQTLVDEKASRKREQIVQIYFSYGEGYSEADSVFYPMQDGRIDRWIDIPEGVTDIRIDPGTRSGICQIDVLTGQKDSTEVLPFSANGRISSEHMVVFEDMDPNFSIVNSNRMKALHLVCEMQYVSEHMLERMRHQIEEDQKFQNMQNAKIQEITERKQQAEQRIAHIESKKVYKIYRAFKRIAKGE